MAIRMAPSSANISDFDSRSDSGMWDLTHRALKLSSETVVWMVGGAKRPPPCNQFYRWKFAAGASPPLCAKLKRCDWSMFTYPHICLHLGLHVFFVARAGDTLHMWRHLAKLALQIQKFDKVTTHKLLPWTHVTEKIQLHW